jgi:hypothetical protein
LKRSFATGDIVFSTGGIGYGNHNSSTKVKADVFYGKGKDFKQ